MLHQTIPLLAWEKSFVMKDRSIVFIDSVEQRKKLHQLKKRFTGKKLWLYLGLVWDNKRRSLRIEPN